MHIVKYDSLNSTYLESMIINKQSFEILGVSGKIIECTALLEKTIEGNGLTCRIYTEGRVASVASGILVPGLGFAAAVSLVAHNLATFNPDYEVAKDLVKNKITVQFKKEPKSK